MGQDSEEAAEFVTTVRTDHVKMKEWYTGNQSGEVAALKQKYGDYPSMWQGVLNWPGWKDTRREFLKSQQEMEKIGNGGTGPTSAPSNNPVPRKRKSRWGSAKDNNGGNAGSNDGGNKRFAPLPNNTGPRVMLPNMSGNPNLNPQQQQELRDMQAKLRTCNERLDNLEREAARVDALPRGHRERSPSPPPIYGADGKRKNTRAVRWRERYSSERQDLLEGIMRLSSKGAPRGAPGGPLGAGIMGGLPGASSLLVRKRVKKIRIPVEEHPTYNFIGLIIGPRGKTQKELEAKTGCKIAIRGRGSVKEGARGRRDGKVTDGDNEPLHVVISGDDQRAVDAASDMVEQMLVVIDDEKNVHKQQQLRELALLNGTLKDEDVFCQICAEKGHRSFECPKRFSAKKGAPGMTVKCAICGDASHPTRDCPRAKAGTTPGGVPATGEKIDSEYLSFMAELDGKKTSAAPPPPNEAGDARKPGAPGAGELPPPPMPNVNLPPPPPPGGLPPPPAGGTALPPAPGGPPQPPPNAPPANFGGPPAAAAPPNDASAGTYGHYQPPLPPPPQQAAPQPPQQQAQASYGGGGHYTPQQQQYGVGYGQQQQAAAAPQVKPGEETAGWDPSSYYGNYGGGGGAGGFNWWEQ